MEPGEQDGSRYDLDFLFDADLEGQRGYFQWYCVFLLMDNEDAIVTVKGLES